MIPIDEYKSFLFRPLLPLQTHFACTPSVFVPMSDATPDNAMIMLRYHKFISKCTKDYLLWFHVCITFDALELIVFHGTDLIFHMNFLLSFFSNSFFPHLRIPSPFINSFLLMIIIPFFHRFNIFSWSLWEGCNFIKME